MIRFIIKRHEVNNNSGQDMTSYKTVDIDVPELEKILSGGGSGPMGFEIFELIGTEIIYAPPKWSSCPSCKTRHDPSIACGNWKKCEACGAYEGGQCRKGFLLCEDRDK